MGDLKRGLTQETETANLLADSLRGVFEHIDDDIPVFTIEEMEDLPLVPAGQEAG